MTEQLTPQWFADRSDRVTGSIVGAILGLNPWSSRSDMMKQKLGYKTFGGNAATAYGSFHEDYAHADFVSDTGLSVHVGGFVVHPDHDWLGASPDGLIGDDAVLEIKCPFRIRDDEQPKFKSIEDQQHYYAQVQIEMFCTGRTKAYFYQWTRNGSKLEIVPFDPDWIDAHFPELLEFYNEWQSRKNEKDDALLAEFEAAKVAMDEAKEHLEAVKTRMIDLVKMRGTDAIQGLSVREIERKGTIQYAKIPELKEIDLEQYRGKSTKFWKVG